MKYALIMFTVFVIAGCTSARDTFAPDGRQAYELNCSGMSRDWDGCYSKAKNLCKSAGYDVLRKTGEGPVPVGRGAGGLYGSQTDQRSMLIACKAGG